MTLRLAQCARWQTAMGREKEAKNDARQMSAFLSCVRGGLNQYVNEGEEHFLLWGESGPNGWMRRMSVYEVDYDLMLQQSAQSLERAAKKIDELEWLLQAKCKGVKQNG